MLASSQHGDLREESLGKAGDHIGREKHIPFNSAFVFEFYLISLCDRYKAGTVNRRTCMHVVVASLSLFITYYYLPARIYVALGRKEEGGGVGLGEKRGKKTSRRLLRLGRAPRVRSSKVKGESVGKGATRYLMQLAASTRRLVFKSPHRGLDRVAGAREDVGLLLGLALTRNLEQPAWRRIRPQGNVCICWDGRR